MSSAPLKECDTPGCSEEIPEHYPFSHCGSCQGTYDRVVRMFKHQVDSGLLVVPKGFVVTHTLTREPNGSRSVRTNIFLPTDNTQPPPLNGDLTQL